VSNVLNRFKEDADVFSYKFENCGRKKNLNEEDLEKMKNILK
jgi:hypothetical protein